MYRRRTDNAMAKRKRTKGQEELSLFVLLFFFLLAIVLSVLLRYMGSDYPSGIFKLFLSFCTFSFGHCVEQQKHYKKRV
jgi:hypothetical protein